MENLKNLTFIIAILILTNVGLASCDNNTDKPDASANVDIESDIGTTTVLAPPARQLPRNEEVPEENYPMYKAGDHVEQKTAANGAIAYDEMYYNDSMKELNSRVVVEYNGKTTKFVDSSVNIGFSPDGRYLVYIHSDIPEDFGQRAVFLYDIIADKSQQLTPYARNRAEYVPVPEEDFDKVTRWTENTISYEARGKTWTLNFKAEE